MATLSESTWDMAQLPIEFANDPYDSQSNHAFHRASVTITDSQIIDMIAVSFIGNTLMSPEAAAGESATPMRASQYRRHCDSNSAHSVALTPFALLQARNSCGGPQTELGELERLHSTRCC